MTENQIPKCPFCDSVASPVERYATKSTVAYTRMRCSGCQTEGPVVNGVGPAQRAKAVELWSNRTKADNQRIWPRGKIYPVSLKTSDILAQFRLPENGRVWRVGVYDYGCEIGALIEFPPKEGQKYDGLSISVAHTVDVDAHWAWVEVDAQALMNAIGLGAGSLAEIQSCDYGARLALKVRHPKVPQDGRADNPYTATAVLEGPMPKLVDLECERES